MNLKTSGILIMYVVLQSCGLKKNTTLENTLVSRADIRIHDIYVAIAIDGEAINKRDEMPRFEINLNTMEVFGNNGCNEFNGKVTSVTERNSSLGTTTMTRKMCRDMEIPAKFDKALQQTASYKFENLHLTLYGKEGKELIKFLKVD